MLYRFSADGYAAGLPLPGTCSTKVVGPKAGRKVASLEKCKERCSNNADCRFIFFNDNNWCIMYKECDGRRTPKRKGTTYEKISNTS